jgi:hypothetical protein
MNDDQIDQVLLLLYWYYTDVVKEVGLKQGKPELRMRSRVAELLKYRGWSYLWMAAEPRWEKKADV